MPRSGFNLRVKTGVTAPGISSISNVSVLTGGLNQSQCSSLRNRIPVDRDRCSSLDRGPHRYGEEVDSPAAAFGLNDAVGGDCSG